MLAFAVIIDARPTVHLANADPHPCGIASAAGMGSLLESSVGDGAEGENVFLDLDGRYRYLSKIVSNFRQGMNTSETSLAVGYRF